VGRVGEGRRQQSPAVTPGTVHLGLGQEEAAGQVGSTEIGAAQIGSAEVGQP